MLEKVQGLIAGLDPLTWWLAAFVLSGLIAGILTGYFRARKIQPNGFRWRIFRNEIFFAAVNISISTLVLVLLRHKALCENCPAGVSAAARAT
jgi:MFS family permease